MSVPNLIVGYLAPAYNPSIPKKIEKKNTCKTVTQNPTRQILNIMPNMITKLTLPALPGNHSLNVFILPVLLITTPPYIKIKSIARELWIAIYDVELNKRAVLS